MQRLSCNKYRLAHQQMAALLRPDLRLQQEPQLLRRQQSRRSQQ